MNRVIIQLTDSKAMYLLKELEKLNLIKLLKTNVQSGKKLSKKYAGKLSPELVEKLQDHVTKDRNEWNKRSI